MEAEEAGGDGPPKAFTIIKDACSQTKAWFIAVCTPPPLESLEALYCEYALLCLPKHSWFRRYMLLLTHVRAFEIVVLMAITANCVTLAMDSNAPDFPDSLLYRQLVLADYVFQGFFSVEALCKIFAMGLVAAPRTYLRNGWNLLDVVIIGTGYISIAGFANVTGLRGLRALRPLRALTRIKEMKAILTSMIASLPALWDVAMVMALYFAIFGTMGVILYGGQLLNRCAIPDFSEAFTDADGFVQDVRYTVLDDDTGTVCRSPHTSLITWINQTNPGTGASELSSTGVESEDKWAYNCDSDPSQEFPYGKFCTPFKNPEGDDFPLDVPGYNSFDNILLSWITIVQHITMTDWAFLMYNLQDGVNWWIWVLHFAMNFLGGMLLINLIVGVIFINYQKGMEEKEKPEGDAEMEALESARKSKMKTSALAGGKQEKAKAMHLLTGSTNPAYGSPTSQTPSQEPSPIKKFVKGIRNFASGTSSSDSTDKAEGRPVSAGRSLVATRDLDSAHQVEAQGSSPSCSIQVGTESDEKPHAINTGLQPKDSFELNLPEFPDLDEEHAKEEAQREEEMLARLQTRARSFSFHASKGALTQSPSLEHQMSVRQMSGRHQQEQQSIEKQGEEEKEPFSCMRLWVMFRAQCLWLVMTSGFGFANAAIICVNAIVLGLNWYNMPPDLKHAMDILNYAFTCYFVIETLVRMIARGIDFFTTRMNWFDFLVTFAGFAEMLVELAPGDDKSRFNGGLTAIRLLRLFRLARYWSGLKDVLTILGHALSSGIYLFALVLLFMFVMGLLGMQLFGHKNEWCGTIEGATQRCPPGAVSCPEHRECYVDCSADLFGQWFPVDNSPYNNMAYCEQFPRDYDPAALDNNPSWPLYWAQVGKPLRLDAHFDDMLNAFLTVFIIISCDNWTNIMFPMMSAITPWVAVYFIIAIVLGAFMLLQLFLAILLGGLDQMEADKEKEEQVKGLKRKPSMMMMVGSVVASFKRLGSMKMSGASHSRPPSESSRHGGDHDNAKALSNKPSLASHMSEGGEHKTDTVAPLKQMRSFRKRAGDISLLNVKAMPHGNRVSPGNSRIPSEAKLHPIRMMPSTPELKEQQQQQQHLSAFSNVSTHSFQPSNSPASSDQHGQQGGDDALLLQELQSPAPTAREPLPLLDIVSPELGKPPQHPLSTAPSSPFIISRGGSRQGSRRVTPVPRASSTPTELGPQILGEGRVQGGDIPGHLQGASPGGDRGDEARLSLHRELTPNSLQDASLSHRGGSSELPQQGTGEEQQHHMRTSRQGNTGERKPSSQEHDSAQEVGAASGWVSPQGVVGEQILGSSSEGEHTPVLGVSQGREEGWIGEPSFAVQGGRALGEGRDSEEAHVMFADTKKQGSGDDYEEPWEQQRVGFVETGDEQDTPPAKRGLFKTARAASQLWKVGVGVQNTIATSLRFRRGSTDIPEERNEKDQLEGTSLNMFGPNHPVRIAIAKFVTHVGFSYFLNFMVLVSCVVLMLDVVSLDPQTKKAIVLRNLDASITAIFGMEVVLKSIQTGFWFNGPGSYFRNGWNQWDVFVVAISIVVLSIDASKVETFTWLAALRALRALRVLHAASAHSGINVVLKALGKLIPTLTNVLWVGLLFYYIFAVLAVALLSGKMKYCREEGGDYIDPYYVVPNGETVGQAWCEATDIHAGVPRTITTSWYHSQIGVDVPAYNITTSWRSDLRHFDNVVTAIWVLYQMASVELWSDVMFSTQAAVAQETQPIKGANPHIGLLWMLFMFVGSFTILNLIVGVSINKFHEMKQEAEGQSPLLTQQQQQWITVQHSIVSSAVEEITIPSNNRIRAIVHKLVYNKITDNFMMFVILGNTVVMFIAHHDMNQQYQDAIAYTNIIVTALFFIEFAAKIFAIGVRTYFKSNWNRFDAVITALSVVGVLVDNLSPDTAAFLPVLRIFRVLRILRLIPKSKGLKKLLRTVYWSIPAVSNVAFVLLVFMYLWAIVGMNLFGNLKITDNPAGNSRFRNFRHFPIAMISLFIMLSGEDWNDCMQDCMQKEDCWLVKQAVSVFVPDGNGNMQQVQLEGGQYLDPVNDHVVLGVMRDDPIYSDNLVDECTPNAMLAVLYFSIYMLVCSYIMVQLVIGIVLESMETATIMENMSVSQDDVQNFVDAWETVDPFGTSYIKVKQITALLSQIRPPLGVKGQPQMKKSIQEIILDVDIPLRGNSSVHFMEVLHALAGRVAGAEIPTEEESHIFHHIAKTVPTETPVFTAAHAYSAMAVASAVRGFLKRLELKDAWNGLLKGNASKGSRYQNKTQEEKDMSVLTIGRQWRVKAAASARG